MVQVNVAPIYDDPSEGVVVMHVNITESVLAKNALRNMTLELEAAVSAYRQVLGNSLDVICTIDEAGRFVQVSEASKDVWGFEPDELIGRRYLELVHPDDWDKTTIAATTIMSGIATSDFDNRYVRKDGTTVDIMWSANWSEIDKSMFCVARDVSQIKQAERALEQSAEQLRQAQKLESVGRLAGGIAHDFNNMLTAIQGYSELTLRRLEDDDPLRRNIEEILKAGDRSAALTRQLLAFSRQQILQPVVLDLNVVITDTVKMLQRLIGEDVQLVAVLNPKAGRVKADAGQVSQIIMNLAVNARDAMPTGGKLTIETANTTFDEEYAWQHVGVISGEYVMLAISDTGTGMSAETQQHIFEPFFTTKEVGKGTGLGLATVYGIVKQSGGQIWVHSEMGGGTTFKIYLPRVTEEVAEEETKHPSDGLLRGSETILLVEDEEMVRMLAHRILEECGYTVLEAGNGAQALALCDKHEGHIDMLMTDVVMPHMGGRELAERMAQMYPEMRILFTSGYTDDAVVRHGVIETGMNFIQKPFTPDGLAQKVREVLDIHREP
jgi:PAS domain S-box-containing protein